MTTPVLNPEILEFLAKLSKNNNREWFEKNKEKYLSVKTQFDEFVFQLIRIANKIDPEIGFLEPRNCTFRIYRDIRFSKDKSPFKTNFGAYISKGGKNSDWAGYYFHLEPSGSFIAGGKYQPASQALKAIRDAIIYEPDVFKGILNHPSFKKHFKEIMGDKLKTAPAGYPKDHPDIDLIKYKYFAVLRPVSPTEIKSPELLEIITSAWSGLKPFNDFLNRAMEHVA
jgi:uncharacterized protein (TIGR02453 family)